MSLNTLKRDALDCPVIKKNLLWTVYNDDRAVKFHSVLTKYNGINGFCKYFIIKDIIK